jgi:hypothetical protein
MNVSSGSSADGRGTRRAAGGGVLAVAAALLIAGCGQAGTGVGTAGGGQTPKGRPDEALRDTIGRSMAESGRVDEANFVKAGGSRLTQLATPFLRTWRIYQVDADTGGHPVWFRVGVDNNNTRAMLVSGDPAAFNKLITTAGVRLTDQATAAQLGRIYLETTRPVDKYTYIVGNVNQIQFRPNLSGTDARRRDQLLRRYARVIAPPRAAAKGGGFEVTAYVVVLSDNVLQRRTLLVDAKGEVRQRATTIARDIPVPWVV